MKKLASSLILGSLLVSSAFAENFLAKITNSALSDNSQGVKVLNLDEMKQVKGGYSVIAGNVSNYTIGSIRTTEAMAIAIPTVFELSTGGICDMGVTSSCYIPGSKEAYGHPEHYIISKTRYKELMAATNNNPTTQFIAFTLRRTMNWSNPYNPIVYYTTGASTVGLNSNGSICKINSNIGNNAMIREMSAAYQQRLKQGMWL